MSTKKVLFACAVALMGISLAGCNNGDASIEQKTQSIAPETYDLQVVGSLKGESAAPTWDPTKPADVQIFKYVSKNSWVIASFKFAVDDEFKFTFNHKWDGDFGYGGVDWTVSAAVKDAFKNAGTDDGGNIKCLTAGTYKLEYRPFYVVEGTKRVFITKVA